MSCNYQGFCHLITFTANRKLKDSNQLFLFFFFWITDYWLFPGVAYKSHLYQRIYPEHFSSLDDGGWISVFSFSTGSTWDPTDKISGKDERQGWFIRYMPKFVWKKQNIYWDGAHVKLIRSIEALTTQICLEKQHCFKNEEVCAIPMQLRTFLTN